MKNFKKKYLKGKNIVMNSWKEVTYWKQLIFYFMWILDPTQAGIFTNLFLKTEGIFYLDDIYCERAELFPANMTLILPCLLASVIAV